MKKKRSRGSSSAVWWLAIFVIIGFAGWMLWHASREGTPVQKNRVAITNRFDLARATNLIHWLGTNLSAYAATNTYFTNRFVYPATNRPPVVTAAPPRTIVVAPSAAPVINVPTNVPATAVITSAPPLSTLVARAAANAPRPVRDIAEAQIALARQAISSGPIDGVPGFQTRAALRAFQKQHRLPTSGDLDMATRNALLIAEPVYGTYVVTATDLARLGGVPESWLEKSQAEALDYETILELVAERHQSSQPFIRKLNPNVGWTNLAPNTFVKVPSVYAPLPNQRAASVRIQLSAKTLQAYDSSGQLLAHFPCSIAQRVEKRPVGVLTVVTAAEDPNYTFDPDVFPESPEAAEIGRKLVIPPGPNNPVGTAWISLDKPGYGIHGTPRPEQVGRTESHGCFRLANWNAEFLLKIVSVGTPVYVEP